MPIIIIGIPRSGTTWIAEIFKTVSQTLYLHEPDNEKSSVLAWLYKKDIHRFPYLTARDSNEEYEKMWRVILSGGYRLSINKFLKFLFFKRRRYAIESAIGERTSLSYIDGSIGDVIQGNVVSPYGVDEGSLLAWLVGQYFNENNEEYEKKRLVVKSVHAPLCAEWLASRFSMNMVIVLRNPYSLYASLRRMKIPDSFRNPLAQKELCRDMSLYISRFSFHKNPFDHLIFQIMLMIKVLAVQIKLNQEWLILSHDRICMSPERNFLQIYNALGLEWSKRSVAKLDGLNKQGKGFNPSRVSKLEPTKWEMELSEEEKKAIDRWIDVFELADFLNEHVLLL